MNRRGSTGRADVLSALSAVASALPGGGEDRPCQQSMARAVDRAVAERRHLIVQAGTGTGKSLAYLLPLAQRRVKAVVATATKALQDQLADKDLPFLAHELGPERELTYAVLKGRSNYFCRQRVSEESEYPELAFGSDGSEEALSHSSSRSAGSVADQIRRLVSWAEHSPSGDRAELDFEPDARAWAAVSVGTRECPGAYRCPSGSVCFAEKARALAAAADVVVVNTHLYAMHLASNGSVLPEHEVVVFDEAHAVEDILTSGLGVEMSGGRLRAMATAARGMVVGEDSRLCDALFELADKLDGALEESVGRRVLRKRGGRNVGRDEELVGMLGLARSRLEALSGALRRAGHGDEDDGGRRTRVLLSLGHLLEDLSEIESFEDDYVSWVERETSSARSPVLRLAPVDVGPLLSQRLWPEVTAILTSATIPPMLGTRLGLPRSDTDRDDVGSPFPFSECALLYCPVDLPDRRREHSEAAVHEELSRIIVAVGGRTLALFTSWRAMTSAVEALRPRLDFVLLAQNDLPKPKLIEAFRDDESSCLFATMSFWQGVDVPGPTLSVVTIDRLPFPRPDDPLLQARRESAGDGAFRVVDLPRAATLLAQGAGRLIRTSTDRGMVAVLDRRLATAGYASALRDVLPPMKFTTRREDAMSFLASLSSLSTPSSRANR